MRQHESGKFGAVFSPLMSDSSLRCIPALQAHGPAPTWTACCYSSSYPWSCCDAGDGHGKQSANACCSFSSGHVSAI